jgi:hypothetical protein
VEDEVCPGECRFEAGEVGDIALDELYIKVGQRAMVITGQDESADGLIARQ